MYFTEYVDCFLSFVLPHLAHFIYKIHLKCIQSISYLYSLLLWQSVYRCVTEYASVGWLPLVDTQLARDQTLCAVIKTHSARFKKK